ncbi:Vacuolar protein sorting-associated protein 41 [Savitreella phatthalungensis]
MSRSRSHSRSVNTSDATSDASVEEPILKYSKLKGELPTLLARDSVSSIALDEQTILLGTHSGVLYVLDADGTARKRLRIHKAAIAAVSLDSTGTISATAGIDGNVVVTNLATNQATTYPFGRPLQTVAIDPEYKNNGKARFVAGGLSEKMVLVEKGWTGQRETVIGNRQGPIMASAWRGNLVAWSNDKGVRLYDTLNMRDIGIVPVPPNAPRPDLFRCRLLWQTDETLLIGWFDQLLKVSIHEGVGKILTLDYEIALHLDNIVAGLARFHDGLLVMCYITQDRETPRRTDAERPEIYIVNDKLEIISEDALGLAGYGRLGANDYDLATRPGTSSSVVYIMSPKDVVIAESRTAADHIQWLADVERYEDALEAAKLEDLSGELSARAIADRYMQHLKEQDDFVEAAKLAPEVFGLEVEAWEREIFAYAEKGHLDAISPWIPVESPRLGSMIYDMVLGSYVRSQPESLLDLIRTWPIEVYDESAIERAILNSLSTCDVGTVRQALAELYVKAEEPRKAFTQYLQLGRPEAFELVQRYNFFDAVQDDILRIVQLGVAEDISSDDPWDYVNAQAIEMLVLNAGAIPPAKVVSQLGSHDRLLFCYLRDAAERAPTAVEPYLDLQLSLFAEYDRDKFSELVHSSAGFPLQQAIEICETRDYIPELIFLLGKTGNNKRALHLIIQKLQDVTQAINFALAQNDEELWEDLIAYSLDKPAFIRGLLEQATQSIDPVDLLRRMPSGTPLAGLKQSLVKVFNDFDLQLSLSQAGKQIHVTELTASTRKLRAKQRRGIALSTSAFPSDTFVVVGSGRLIRREVIDSQWQPRREKQHARKVADKVTDCALHREKLLAVLEMR